MIRGVFVYINIVLATLVSMPLYVALSLIDKSGRLARNVAWLWGGWIMLSAGVSVRITGKENIGSEKSMIFFSNHASYFDVFSLMAHLPVPCRLIAKKELFQIPFFGWTLLKGGHIQVDRSNSRQAYQSMLTAAERIKNGTPLIIFAEGTRSPDGTLKPFKTGGPAIAIMAKAPVYPVAVLGTFDIHPRGTLKVNKGRIDIRIGRPILTEDLKLRDKVKLTEEIRSAIEKLLGEERQNSVSERRDTPSAGSERSGESVHD